MTLGHILNTARTLVNLGVLNSAFVASYRFLLRSGYYKQRMPIATPAVSPFFQWTSNGSPSYPEGISIARWVANAKRVEQGTLPVFSHQWKFVGFPPQWHRSLLTGRNHSSQVDHWSIIPDFSEQFDDIKLYWESSRFDGLLILAIGWLCSGNKEFARAIEIWLVDWSRHNPPNAGIHWKCAQESSIRLMQMLLVSVLLEMWGQIKPADGFLKMVVSHLHRIEVTTAYAKAQDNNHGTSEAAALFMGGSWVSRWGNGEGERWTRMGRKWLENSAARLIGDQGTFSQYSLNYHRVMLDTFCMVEVWRRHFGLSAFSDRWQTQAFAATQWMRHMINPINGDGPNVGANDGARLLQLAATTYRDYRPTVQLSMALFANEQAYAGVGSWNDALQWLQIPLPEKLAAPVRSYLADDGGFAMLHKGQAMVMLRYPRFNFRPSQADALHLDLWVSGQNLLRDAGSYSYNTAPEWLAYFGGTASHNTVQFDGRDQMPRLSRFLFGRWLTTSKLEILQDDGRTILFGAGYVDHKGARHHRHLALSSCRLQVQDEISGFASHAILRWRLAPGDWQLVVQGGQAQVRSANYPSFALSVRTGEIWQRCELVDGWESLHYAEKTMVPVLEIQVEHSSTITTEVSWSA